MTVWPSVAAAAAQLDEAALVGQLGGRDILLPANDSRAYPVRAHLWAAAAPSRGRVLILPGFTEFCEKYALFARALVTSGYECLIIDWPGQGRSGQLGAHQLIVHLDRFSAYYQALDEVLSAAGWQAERFSIFGHSLGGHLGLNIAKAYPQLVDRLVLCAPMIVPKAPPVWLTRLLATMLMHAGWRYRALPFVAMPSLEDRRRFRLHNLLTRSPEGYDRQYQIFETRPELRRVHASVGWIRAAFDSCAMTTLNPDWMGAVDVPVLALMPGDERVVDPAASRRMLSYLPDCRLVWFADARHELLSELPEVTTRLYTELDQFLAADTSDQLTKDLTSA